MKKYLMAISVIYVLVGSSAFAIDNYDLEAIQNLTDDKFPKAMIQTVGLGMDHRAYSPASPLGLVIGVDVGVSVTAIALPTDFKQALALASGTPEGGLPALIPVPQLSFRKGLPAGFDIGFSFVNSGLAGMEDDLFSIYGGDVQWAFLSGKGPLPAVAARLGATWSKLWFIETSTYSLDVVASKNLFLINPYVGTGLKYWSGTLNIPAGQTLPVDVSASHSSVSPHFFFGLPINMVFLKLTFEADYAVGGETSYGAKLSLNF